ncbi:YhdP family protein [Oceanobacter sp. 5_MG-2023]|uniref:YhdP family protein n=1 Tax=Oceanobacter sp. 5_MG-2023 TaxID=3062645 RepID=UPI0026E3D49A|nr:YhdP family protein [Oceanobacter sp. 5_MG-2023]MDO6681994.1 YhdP family protein [Oceanobacter sp. 5_MG-2023]
MRFLGACWTQLWITLVVGLVMTALYTSAGRQLIPLVESWHPDIEQQLTQQLGQPVVIGKVEGDWRYLSPIVRLRDIVVGVAPDQVSLRRVELELDVSASAFYQLPVFKRIEVEGLELPLRRAPQQWFIGQNWALSWQQPSNTGTDSTAASPAASGTSQSLGPRQSEQRPLWARLLELQQRMEITDSHIQLQNANGKVDQLQIEQLLWRHQGGSQSILGKLSWGREQLADITLNAVLDGQVWPWREQNGEVFAYVEPQSWTRWIPNDLPMELVFNQLDAGADVWLKIHNGELSQVYADLNIEQLELTTREQPLSLSEGRIQLGGEHHGDDWHMRIMPDLGDAVPVHDFTISAISLPEQSRGWQLGLAQLEISQAIGYLLEHGLLPDPFDRYLGNIQPGGQAQDVRISFLPEAETNDAIDVRAQLQNIHGSAYQGIPGMKGLNGHVHLQPTVGRIDFKDQTATIDLQGVYDEPWSLSGLSGAFHWRIQPEESRIWLTGLQARWQHLQLRSELSMTLPSRASGRDSRFSLLLGMPRATMTDRSRLLPDLLDPEVRHWLDTALLSGKLSNGAFLLDGVLDEERPDNSLTTQLYMDVQRGELKYLEGWPVVGNVTGRVLLDTPSVDAWVDGADTLGGHIEKGAHIRLRSGADHSTRLLLNGRLKGDSGAALRYFTDTPLQEVVGHAFDHWQGQGSLQAVMAMDMALGDDSGDPEMRIEAQLDDNQLRLDDLNLEITGLTGALVYDSIAGLSSPRMEGHVMGGDMVAKMTSKPLPNGFSTQLRADGRATMAAFKQWLPMFLLDPVTGDLGYQATLDLNTTSGDVRFALDTNLDGTLIDYPAPLGKAAADASHPLHVTVRPGRETRISMNYDDRIRGVFALDDQGLNRGQVYLGKSEPFLPSDSGVEIRGQLDTPVNAEEWWDMWLRLEPLALAEEAASSTAAAGSGPAAEQPDSDTNAGTRSSTSENPLRLVDLIFTRLDVWDMAPGPTHVIAQQNWGEWQTRIDSELMAGDVVLSAGSDPVQMTLEYLHMPQTDDVVKEPGQRGSLLGEVPLDQQLTAVLADDTLLDMVPADLLPMDIQIAEMIIGSRNLGRWSLSSRPIEKGLALTINDSDMKGLKFNGDIRWLQEKDGHRTYVDMLKVRGKDIGKVQQAFRQEPIIDGKELTASASLEWRGSPLAFNPVSLQGLVSLRINDGVWKTEGTGALKAFGILNFNSISRRLQLDFSDLYQSGMAFDVMKAKADIVDGTLTFSEPLVVDGPGAKFLVSGNTNLVTETLDMKLAVTFPVTGSLPLVAVLAGFAPQIAGAIYVTEKLIGDELEKFTSASYDITGRWSTPKMKIRQAFDNDVDGKKSRSFKQRFLSIFGLEESR